MLLLREVLGFPAADVASMLGITTAAVKSSLQRARARPEEAAPARNGVIEPTDPHARALLGYYIHRRFREHGHRGPGKGAANQRDILFARQVIE